MTATAITEAIDRTGKTITTFVVYDAERELAGMAEGEVLELITDDFKPIELDVAAWTDSTGHELLASEVVPAGRRFLIKKGSERPTKSSLAVVISDAGLEELLSPLGFALAGALEGMDVSLFVQGPAVRVLTRGYRPKLRGWARPFSRLAAAGMAKTGHIAAQQKLAQLLTLGATIYVCGPSMQHFKVDKDEFAFSGLLVVEYLTFMAVMREADVQLYT
ncbi:MAG: DsrE family protein [Acidimicrobiia bacterium]|nr:DsrE family protein [Acidimicrobiia bacterium]